MASVDSSTDSLFEEDWKAFGADNVGLGAVSAFNATFDGQQDNQCNVGNGLDPQLFSTASSLTLSNAAFDATNAVSMPISISGGIIPDFYPTAPPHAFSSAAGQIFHQSIEQQSRVMLQAPAHPGYSLRGQSHRRSVSEPPDQHHLPGHHFPPHAPPGNVTFTRAGVPLGLPRNTAARQNGRAKGPTYRQPYSVVKKQVPSQQRYQLRRTQTQPVRPANTPTSMPHMPVVQSPLNTGLALPPASAVVSSRVCTPAPSHDLTEDSTDIDPRLLTTMKTQAAKEEEKAAAIPVTVDELKAMIIDAVQQAIKGASQDGREDPSTVAGGVSNDVSVAEPNEVANDRAE